MINICAWMAARFSGILGKFILLAVEPTNWIAVFLSIM
jgi:hypothetical protein